MNAPESDCTPRDLLAALRERYPDAPFLALGQTVFWDEPVKAVLRQLLDQWQLGGQITLGVHDTDYFARTRLRTVGPDQFALMAHNDGTTRDLWSAAGEISTLFGSETFPTHDSYVRYGVPFRKVAQHDPEGSQAFLDRMTEAWGWRGLIYTGDSDFTVHWLPLRDVGDGILEMLAWGLDNALAQIVPGCCQDEARKQAETILGWCRDFRAARPDANLTHLFQDVLPRFYELLLGRAPENVNVDCTAHLLRLNPETAGLPRFRFVNAFLDPATRDHAVAAYNQVVAGSEIYTLDKFGMGALPFDLIVPGRGRGTLRLTDRVLWAETPQPIAIGLPQPIRNVAQLADVLTRKLGDHVTLVGKAVSLVSMLAQEFIFVFNEEGSLYVRRTRQMNDLLAAQGVALDMKPILRMRYRTWDSLSEASATLRPTEHLAATFGQPTITAPDFAAQWQDVIVQQEALLDELKTLRKPIELLRFLQTHQPQADWDAQTTQYQAARQTLKDLRGEAADIQWHIEEQYARLRALRHRQSEAQKGCGAHFRSVTEWTPAEIARRAAFEGEMRGLERGKQIIRREAVQCNIRRKAIERGPEAVQSRRTLADIENRAELARLHLIRNALLTIEGLRHTDHRPSVWWLPLVDPSGAWFRRMVQTTTLYLEPLQS